MRRSGNIFYTIIVFTGRRDPPGNMDGRRWYETGPRRREGSEKGATKKRKRGRESEPGCEGDCARKRVDNSQDRIVPGAKNRSIPECYRMVETRER